MAEPGRPGGAGADLPGYLAGHARAIAAAAERVRPHVHRTPLLETDLDPRLRLKAECFQRTGSFKARGAFNAVLSLLETGRPPPGVVAVSSGNHAQAVALAARTAGLAAVIVIPDDASPAKVAATRALGAEVIQGGVTMANRDRWARQLVAERGLVLVHPYDDWDVIHGQGTAAREVLDEEPEVASLVAAVGGGGLLSGSALAARARDPRIRVIGVEPERAADASRSFASGRLERLEAPPQTIADGVRSLAIGRRPFEVLVERRLADAIVTVSEEQIGQATRVAWLQLKLALEPTAALPLAAHLSGRLDSLAPAHGPRVLLLSGGNAQPDLVARLLARP